MILLVGIGIAIISLAWAWFSLTNDLKKTEHSEKVKKDLAKGRVIFYSSAPSSEDSKD